MTLNPLAPSIHEQRTTSPIHTLRQRMRILDIGRLGVTVLSVGAAVAVVGCEAHSWSAYKATKLDEEFPLPALWPRGLDLRPMQGVLVGGAVVALVGLVYLLCGIVPVPTRFGLLRTLFSVSLAVIGLGGAIFGVAYSTHITNRPDNDRDTIQSWTCRWVDGAADVKKLFANSMAAIAAPQGFGRVCTESHAGFSLLVTLICLQTVVLVLTGLCAWMDVKMRRAQRELADDDVEEKDMPDGSFY